MWGFEKVFFVVARSLPVVRLHREFRGLWWKSRWNALLVFIVLVGSASIGLINFLVVMLVVTVVKSHQVVLVVVRIWVVVEDHCCV